MTGQTALLGMAGRAAPWIVTDRVAVPSNELRSGVARGCFELGLDGERPRVGSQRLNGRHLRRVHVTGGAEIAGVAGGAARGDAGRGAATGGRRLGEVPVP